MAILVRNKGLSAGLSVEDVADFFTEAGFKDFAFSAKENDIDGEALVLLDHEALKELGLTKVGARLKVLRLIHGLGRRQKAEMSAQAPERPSSPPRKHRDVRAQGDRLNALEDSARAARALLSNLSQHARARQPRAALIRADTTLPTSARTESSSPCSSASTSPADLSPPRFLLVPASPRKDSSIVPSTPRSSSPPGLAELSTGSSPAPNLAKAKTFPIVSHTLSPDPATSSMRPRQRLTSESAVGGDRLPRAVRTVRFLPRPHTAGEDVNRPERSSKPFIFMTDDEISATKMGHLLEDASQSAPSSASKADLVRTLRKSRSLQTLYRSRTPSPELLSPAPAKPLPPPPPQRGPEYRYGMIQKRIRV